MRKRSVKKYLAVALTGAMLCGLITGCNEAKKTEDDPESDKNQEIEISEEDLDGIPKGKGQIVGKVSFNINEAYHQAECQWFENYANACGYEPIILDGAADAETMINSVQDLISKDAEAIVIQPADNANAEAVVQEAQAAGVPLATFVNQADTTNPHIRLYETPSAEELGAAAAEKWMEWYPDEKIVMAIIDYPASQQVHEERALAFVDGVQSVAPDAEVAVILDGEASRDKSMSCGEDILQSHPEVNMVYGINANSVLGALAAFEAAGRGQAEDGIPKTELFVGTDGSEQEAIKIYDPDSSLKLTMALSPKNNAKVHLQTLIKMMDGEIEPTSDYEVEVTDVVMDYWSTSIDDFQAFLTDEYFSTIDLKKELGL